MAEQSKQRAYTGSYDEAIKSLYEKIAGRHGFKYEYSADPQYQAYKESYTRQGRQAMQDSMAQAAHLTGGYGSSYAQRVGSEAYGGYLEKLNDALPQLYSAAYQRYKGEGDALSAQLEAAMALGDAEYQRHNDAEKMAFEREQFDYQKQDDAFGRLYDIITGTGYVPGEDELLQAGMSAEQAGALSYEFLRSHGLLPSAGRSSGGRKEVDYYNLSPTSINCVGYREGMFDNKSSGGSSSGSSGSSSGKSSGGSSGKNDDEFTITTHA